MWVAPTTNCNGTPLTDLDHYVVTTGQFACVDDVCIEGHVSIDIPAGQAGYMTDLYDDLAVGEGYWYRVEAVDKARNVSCNQGG